jgi:hypothetical protein
MPASGLKFGSLASVLCTDVQRHISIIIIVMMFRHWEEGGWVQCGLTSINVVHGIVQGDLTGVLLLLVNVWRYRGKFHIYSG